MPTGKDFLKTTKGEDTHRQHVEEQAGSDQVVQGGASFAFIHLINGRHLEGNKLAKLRRHASRVHFARIHFV